MRGDRLPGVTVTSEWGIPGDRGWAIRDELAGEIRGARRVTSLLQFHARYLTEPEAGSTPTVEITFPDGSSMTSDDDRIDKALSAAVDREVTLWPRRPADDHEHYRRARASEQELRAQHDLGPDDPMPDFSSIPEEVMKELTRYATPRGTYFDTMPLSLLTTSSMDSLAASVPGSVVDSRRFRQNIVVRTEAGAGRFPEFDWVDHRLQIGEVLVEVVMPITRCVMVVLPQADLPHDRPILRSLVRQTGMDLGVYLRVDQPGEIAEGDPVHLR